MSNAVTPRMTWFDANRVCAAIGVVLIHSTADFHGGVFPDAAPAERIVPVLARVLAELSGSEMFFTFSLFLLAFKLDRRRPTYGAAVEEQARRLLVPFVFWALFYVGFRLIKAQEFGYSSAILDQISQAKNWYGYALLGTSQYHLHFLPTLFVLVLFFPVMRLAQRYPLFGLCLPVCLAVMHEVQVYIWGLPVDPLTRDALLRAVKAIGYVGYGFAAFALYGLWKNGIARGESALLRRGAIFLVALATLATVPRFADALLTGAWGGREGAAFWGHYLMPIAVFAVFLGAQFGEWSPRWSKLAKYSFGVYLLHPAMIDLFDVAVHASGTDVSPAVLVISRFALVLPTTFGLAVLIARTPLLAWTIGLGELPWKARRAPAAVAQV